MGRSLFTLALAPEPRRRLTCVRPGRLCIQQSLRDTLPYLTLPTDLTRSFIWLQVRGAKDSRFLSRSLIIILTRAILTMAEVPLFQYGWQTTSVPQLRPHGSVVDKLSVFSASRYAGLALSPCDVTFTDGPGPNLFLASTRIPIADP